METLEQTRLRLENFAKEVNPDADISPGSVLSEWIIKLAATMHNPIKADLDSISQAKAISDAITSTVATYSPIIDAIASNYNVARNQGRKVTGQLKVTVKSQRNYFVDPGFKFTQPNLALNYIVPRAYNVVVKAADAVLADNEVRLLKEGALFYFVVPVEAEAVGSTAQVANATKFVLAETSRLVEFVQAEAYGTFSSGQNIETDQELITRFKLGQTTKNLVSPYAINAVLQDKFPTFKAVSVIGSNDAEMVRSKHNLFGIAVPGCADLYVRTVESLETKKLKVIGTRIGTDLWQVNIDSVSAPGFYRVMSIVKDGNNVSGTQVFQTVAYNYEILDENHVNNFETIEETRFSKYQSCQVTFSYDGVTSTENFLVTVLYQPLISEIQDLFLTDDDRISCADYMVRAAIPCNVNVYLKLVKKFPLVDLPVDKIKQDIFSYVNNIPFGEDLSVSKIIDICHDYDIRYVELPIIVKGTIIVPSSNADESIEIQSTDTLVIPTQLDKGISKNTTTFFINYFSDTGEENISIDVS